MSSAVHIPKSDISDVKSLLDMALEGTVIVERGGESFQLTRRSERTAAEILADPNIKWSEATLDEGWSKDMQAIYEANRKNDRDPWQE